MRVAVVGGGAAGFFAAINVKEKFPEANVVIFEKSSSVLSKLKISGGGRCNITNAAKSIYELSKAYPRGEKALKKMFQRFSNVDAMDWFQKRGLPLTIQQDNCVFPVSQNSQSVIDCFLNVCEKLNITTKLNSRIRSLQMKNDKFLLGFQDGNLNSQEFDFVIITTGGSPKPEGLEWLKKLGHEISPPVPSLFSLSIKDKPLNKLMGVVVEDVVLKIQSEKFSSNGALLITHWGISGPATLKLSSFAARFMNEKNYAFKLQVNWVGGRNDELITQELWDISRNHQAKIMANYRPFNLPTALWHLILDKCNILHSKLWRDGGKTDFNKIANFLSCDIYSVTGKTAFKEEYVTCGGVSLDSVDLKTMQSSFCKNLYFAGEVLDIDGVTGGFNFQAAWTTAYIASFLGK